MPENSTYSSSYTATYTSFSGADIVATFDGVVIGNLQAISYSVTREKVPIYTMGSPDPRSFSRGKRGIAGSMVFTVFDRDVLAQLKTKGINKKVKGLAGIYSTVSAEANKGGVSLLTPDQWEEAMQKAVQIGSGSNNGFVQASFMDDEVESVYADQIPPFDVNITFRNEYGNSATLSILAVELLNEGSGMSIDDITTEKACTFVARGLSHLRSGTDKLSPIK